MIFLFEYQFLMIRLLMRIWRDSCWQSPSPLRVVWKTWRTWSQANSRFLAINSNWSTLFKAFWRISWQWDIIILIQIQTLWCLSNKEVVVSKSLFFSFFVIMNCFVQNKGMAYTWQPMSCMSSFLNVTTTFSFWLPNVNPTFTMIITLTINCIQGVETPKERKGIWMPV